MAPDKYPLEPLVGRILSPFERFLGGTVAGGLVLVAATVLALILGAAFGDEALHHFWNHKAGFSFDGRPFLQLTLHHWVNDGLMALFFLLVGLELKREIQVGELASMRDAALPVVAALGGMVVPATIYTALNAGTSAASGWGIPMATDIAFAIGILVLLSWRVPRNLVIFLTALAIADDLGAVLVIAVFYTSSLDNAALVAVAVLTGVLVLLNRGGVRNPLPYGLVGILLWYAMLRSGIHATVAGIVLAFSIPARPAYTPAQHEVRMDELNAAFTADRRDPGTVDNPLRNERMVSITAAMERSARMVQSPLQRLERALALRVTFVVVPLFALANAGIDLGAIEWSSALAQRSTLGIVLGLVLGKFIGVSLFCWVAIRLGIARLPTGVEWRHLLGAAWLAGIGFTMSLFIAQLAFTDPRMVDSAKLGILLGSAIAATIGVGWLVATARKP